MDGYHSTSLDNTCHSTSLWSAQKSLSALDRIIVHAFGLVNSQQRHHLRGLSTRSLVGFFRPFAACLVFFILPGVRGVVGLAISSDDDCSKHKQRGAPEPRRGQELAEDGEA